MTAGGEKFGILAHLEFIRRRERITREVFRIGWYGLLSTEQKTRVDGIMEERKKSLN